MDVSITLPWVFGAVAALWLGLAAWKAGRSWVGWAVGGALTVLILGTIVFGLIHASAIPVSEHGRVILRVKTAVIFAALLIAVGGLITRRLLRRDPTAPAPGQK